MLAECTCLKWTSEDPADTTFHSSEQGRFGRRARSSRDGRIRVFVVTGFLGAGKTTLLQRLLDTPQGANSAVVVNEFGEIGIDHALLRDSSEDTVLLGNGCLCCTMRTDLELTLRSLFLQRLRGEVSSFERVLIETTGIAEIGPILRTFARDRSLGEAFHVEAVVAVVDAVHGPATLSASPEARQQVALADRIVITKSDMVETRRIEEVRSCITVINPLADSVCSRQGRVDPKFLLAPASDLKPRGECEGSSTSTHLDDVNSFALVYTRPLAWTTFSGAMNVLTSLRGPDLLRVKGFLAVEGCRGPVIVHVVQHLVYPPMELGAWPDDDHRSRLVFVTRRLEQRRVAALFDAVADLESESD